MQIKATQNGYQGLSRESKENVAYVKNDLAYQHKDPWPTTFLNLFSV